MKNILVTFSACCLFLFSYSQDTYIRPSVSLINIDFKNSSSTLDLGSVNVPKNLDKLFMSKDRFSTSTSAPKDDSNKKELEEISNAALKDFVNKKVSNAAIMAVLPISNGEYNYDAVLERGVNSATDQDVNLTSQSKIAEVGNEKDRYLYITEKMLNRNYVVAFNMPNFSNYSDETSEGIQGHINYVVFKINSIYANSDITISASALPGAKVNADVVVSGRTINMTATNFKDKSMYVLTEPKTPEELRDDLQTLLLQMVWDKAGRKVEAFQPRTTLLAKRMIALGVKENLKIDNRFFVYENVQNRKGEVVKKKRGTMRVRKVGNNAGKATGKSEKSKLYKIGYGKAREGMLVQQKDDIGVGISLGYGEYSWLRVDGRVKGTWPGFLLFLDVHPFPGKVEFDMDAFKSQGAAGSIVGSGIVEEGDFSAFAINIYAGFERQIRLGPALYLSPFLGGGYSTVSLSGDVFTYGEGLVSYSYTWDSDDSEIYGAVLATGGARLGLQLSHSLSVNFTLGYLLPVMGGWKDPKFSFEGSGVDSYYNYGILEEETDQETLESYYEGVIKDMPTIPDGMQTTIMLRYEF